MIPTKSAKKEVDVATTAILRAAGSHPTRLRRGVTYNIRRLAARRNQVTPRVMDQLGKGEVYQYGMGLEMFYGKGVIHS